MAASLANFAPARKGLRVHRASLSNGFSPLSAALLLAPLVFACQGGRDCDRREAPQSAPKIQLAFDIETDTPVWLLYRRLKQDGVKDSALDSGYLHVDYFTKQFRIVHGGDRVIQAEEVLEYALERYQQYASAIKDIMGYSIPWALDDLDPNTDFDALIRRQIDSAIDTFDKTLSKGGYTKATNGRDEPMAMALFAFTLFPKIGSGSSETTLTGLETELRSAGLGGALQYLKTEGGLGRINVQRDCVLEASALEALKDECGKCSEDSKILYGVFERAGLNSRMVYAKLNYSSLNALRSPPGFLHFSLALTAGNRTRLFDLTNRTWNAGSLYGRNMHWWFPASNRQALSLHYAGLCIRYVKISKPDPAIEECEKALQLDPLSFVAFINLGAAQEKKGRFDLAAANFRRALRIHPDFAEAYYGLGRVHYGKRELDLAAQMFEKAIELHPGFAEAYNNLGVVFLDRENREQAALQFEKALRIEPGNPSYGHNLALARERLQRFVGRGAR